ncbi:TIGR04086 family membrane protein [Aneurinibacillus terranovensis]|uniref:TIGR04086 family membrane protein n=1 Tax=Aneurinibacillus terranovensis TaxID=278991 RepID=UPI00041AE771|nr:TIGR04086 family membrane protein [Aneurinibacillus terranovensis]
MVKMERITLPILSGVLYSTVIVVIGALVTSLILAFSSLKEASLPSFVYSINSLALFVGGFVSGKKGGEKGWYYGGMTGIAFYTLILLFSFLGFNTEIGISRLYHAILAFIISSFGGIIGVNVARK